MSNMQETESALLEVRGLTVCFHTDDGPLEVVHDAGFAIGRRETAALVGESGCGKSVTAHSLARLIPSPPVFYPAGEVLFEGVNTLTMSRRELRTLRGGGIAYVFQDPSMALNPVLRVGFQIGESLRGDRRSRREGAARLLALVGLPSPVASLDAYPHELSGGQQQRVVIAMALTRQPALLVADEPTTALDVMIQAQILALLKTLQVKFGMSVLLITHNLGLVAAFAHRVNVMYAGCLVERGETTTVLRCPAHPYTRGLLDVVPRLSRPAGRLRGIPGTVPSTLDRPAGCPFAPRCARVGDRCRIALPSETRANEDPGHRVRCYHPLKEGEIL